MSKIQKIYIACCKKDAWFTKLCVASIRYWYPRIPIFLIKDYLWGDFDTSEIEQRLDVSVLDTERKKLGWGFSKLEAMFLENNERILVFDSDTVFVGRVV